MSRGLWQRIAYDPDVRAGFLQYTFHVSSTYEGMRVILRYSCPHPRQCLHEFRQYGVTKWRVEEQLRFGGTEYLYDVCVRLDSPPVS